MNIHANRGESHNNFLRIKELLSDGKEHTRTELERFGKMWRSHIIALTHIGWVIETDNETWRLIERANQCSECSLDMSHARTCSKNPINVTT